MADKEIIIDGVDVSGCSELFKTTQRPQCALIDQYYCETNPDCYYKQLKRLEFENQLLKADYEASEQENAELKKDIKACNTCEHSTKIYGNEIAELKAENERLKKELKNNKSAYEVELGTYNMECGNLLEENKQLLQTLQEIKEIADAKCNECKYGKDGISCKYGDCGEAKLHLITQLITKAEEE